MRKLLLSISLLCGIGGFSQNIADNKVSFDFIQLPTNPIHTDFTTYQIIINKLFENANSDSMATYQARQDAVNATYDAEMVAWTEQKRGVDRQYLTTLASWEKNTLATGTVVPKPEKPAYPPHPLKQDVLPPFLHDDVSDQYAGSKINLQGFSSGGGGALITLDINPISELQIVKTTKGTGAGTQYVYEAQYKMPVTVRVDCPNNGTVFNTMIGAATRKYSIKTFTTTYDYEIWMMDNRDQFWIDLQNSARAIAMNEIDNALNEACGYPLKKRNTEVYSVKKHKDFSYPELNTAYTTASQGYRLIAESRDRSTGIPKLMEAIAIWEGALKESNMSDDKSRVNDKITAMLHYNIAEAYMWMGQFDEAEKYANLAISDGVMKFKGPAKDLKGYNTARKQRWNANF